MSKLFRELDSAERHIHLYNGKWWFWDEVQVDRIGPYNTHKECQEALNKYANEL